MTISLLSFGCGALALCSIHSTVFGAPQKPADFDPQQALKMAVYYAAHPGEISLERIQRETSKKLLQSNCFDSGELRRCNYSVAEEDESPGLQSVTVSSTTAGASLGGFITWQFSQASCVSDATVARFLGQPSASPGMPPTVPQPFAASEPVSDRRNYRNYESTRWNRETTIQTVSTKCLETLVLKAQLPKA